MNTGFDRTLVTTMIAVSAIVSSQCSRSDVAAPTAPGAVSDTNSYAVVGPTTNSQPVLGQFTVCKAGNVSGTFTVVASPAGPPVSTVTSPVTIAAGTCQVVAENLTITAVDITVTETSAGLQSIAGQRNDNGSITPDNPPNGAVTRTLNSIHGFAYTFTNNVVVEPPPGDQGCTPGYWKQPHHLDSWTTYLPGADFDTTFGVNFFNPDITLLAAAGLGGGGLNALARHAVAAILNVASADVDYTYTLAQVLDIVQGDGEFAGLSVEARKNLLAAANEAGCPLN